jgi:uncharacterized membrane protein YidH (DUF202 family)
MSKCTKKQPEELKVAKYSNKLSAEKDYTFILEQHLHAQFAENSNAHVSSFVTFVVSLLALFGAFGYVYANTVNVFRIGFGFWPELPFGAEKIVGHHVFTMDCFLWLTIIVSIILCFIACLCIFLGYAERRDQVEQWFIRERHGLKTVYSNPTDRRWLCFLSDYYRMFYHLLMLLQVLVFIVCLFRVRPFFHFPCANLNAIHLVYFTFAVQLVCLVVCLITSGIYYFWKYKKTVERCYKKDTV